ncbi:nuclease-related domain-containing protein [Nocardioides nanhaiensis]|uniref:NERD domain-containing protein n=1 Tax=Nocardioides nanhaiensis TaxID=1476871 RepID=A0ABP8W5W7_9ACTN
MTAGRGEGARATEQRFRRLAERWVAGRESTHATAVALSALPPSEWVVLHEPARPGRSRRGCDHLVVGPAGVVVIDSASCAGYDRDDPVMTTEGLPHPRVVRDVQASADAVSERVPGRVAASVWPVLCVGWNLPRGITVGRTRVTSPAMLPLLLADLPPVLSAPHVVAVAHGLRQDLASRSTARAGRGRSAG